MILQGRGQKGDKKVQRQMSKGIRNSKAFAENQVVSLQFALLYSFPKFHQNIHGGQKV